MPRVIIGGMELVNWDGAIFGPGSEWFWAMAQFVVVTITLVAIYRQLRAQGSANAMQRLEALDARWQSDRMCRARLAVAESIKAGKSGEADLPLLGMIGNFYEGLGTLVRDGHMPKREVIENWSLRIRFWWTILEPAIQQRRVLDNDPDGLEQFENLDRIAREYDARLGQSLEFDAATRTRWLIGEISQIKALLVMDAEAEASADAVDAAG